MKPSSDGEMMPSTAQVICSFRTIMRDVQVTHVVNLVYSGQGHSELDALHYNSLCIVPCFYLEYGRSDHFVFECIH